MENFATPPYPLDASANLRPHKINVPAEELEKLNLLLDNLPVADTNWENSQQDGRFGVTRDWLLEAVDQWRHKYNWRTWENEFNSFPQFLIDVKDDDGHVYTVRFNALFSKKPKAVPIIFLHGWPGSTMEFIPMLKHIHEQFPTPDVLPYHIIVPDLIGFGFSSRPPLDKDFTHEDAARIYSKMMNNLGFNLQNGGYVAQGGDVGSIVTPVIGTIDPACRLVHVNMFFLPPPAGVDVQADIAAGEYSQDEVEAIKRGGHFRSNGFAYGAIQGTRPATAGLAIGSSPVGLLAWIGEKLIQWSDPSTQPSMEHILTNVSFYWFSKCYPTSLWIYRYVINPNPERASAWANMKCPLGYSWFKYELSHPPKKWRDSIEVAKWFRSHEKGGHFAALEQPVVLWKDVTDIIADFDL